MIRLRLASVPLRFWFDALYERQTEEPAQSTARRVYPSTPPSVPAKAAHQAPDVAAERELRR
jgi:hypothetical protein